MSSNMNCPEPRAAGTREEEGLYSVDEILGVRIENGVKEYLLKWTGYDNTHNSWVPEGQLDCLRKIRVFEANLALATDKRKKGFDKGLVPEKIIGATNHGGPLNFLMKWVGSNEPDLVTAEQANVKCPQVVIKFYEERIKWS
ncbi:unnamed protein product [Ceutorhynchus assimilis]|uniref:Chromo domain-containing protein n=1 Tax=Ceutorhynchus assimilis TaxID=467358 RepID=A0A9N9QIZ0_9CUCU|nr:unnamed protein product [Ceutorhynchus assimilis]